MFYMVIAIIAWFALMLSGIYFIRRNLHASFIIAMGMFYCIMMLLAITASNCNSEVKGKNVGNHKESSTTYPR